MVGQIKFGINVPNFGDYWDPRMLAELACDAEDARWDGFFLWDHISGVKEWQVPVAGSFVPIGQAPFVDPWVALAAIAVNTRRMRIGALVTPLARRRPWKLARETVSLDHLSVGRLVVGVGLGGQPLEFTAFGEDENNKVRAEKLDEGLEVLTGLWKGKEFSHFGKHYRLKDVTFMPKPVQSPRIPIWVACFWPNKKPLQRAARFDGVVPASADWTKAITPQNLRQIVKYVTKHRTDPSPFDIVIGGQTPSDPEKGAEIVQRYIQAGATWWSEDINGWRGTLKEMRQRIQHGPPKA